MSAGMTEVTPVTLSSQNDDNHWRFESMKKKLYPIIILSTCFLLTACSLKNSQSEDENTLKNRETDVNTQQQKEETDELSARLKQYKSFLKDEICSENKSNDSYYLKDFCNSVVPEKTEDGIRYALFDMTGDGMPELHVLTDISYSIHTIEDNKLITWYEGDRYNRPLNNGAILQKVESTGTHYAYIVLDSNGEEVICVCFSEPPGSKSKYLFTTGDEYIELSKSDWDKLTRPFLTIGSDKIIWKDINNLDF